MKVNIALLTVTDTRTLKNDKSGSILVKKIKGSFVLEVMIQEHEQFQAQSFCLKAF